jgi:hypothetical protein
MVKKGSPAAQHWIGAVVGSLQGQEDSAEAHPDQGGTKEVCWELLRPLLAQIMFAGQRKCRSIYDFGKFVSSLIHRKFLNLQKCIRQNKMHTINCFCWGKT